MRIRPLQAVQYLNAIDEKETKMPNLSAKIRIKAYCFDKSNWRQMGISDELVTAFRIMKPKTTKRSPNVQRTR